MQKYIFLVGHTEAILSVSFSPDGECLASCSGDTTVRLWDILTQTPIKVIVSIIERISTILYFILMFLNHLNVAAELQSFLSFFFF